MLHRIRRTAPWLTPDAAVPYFVLRAPSRLLSLVDASFGVADAAAKRELCTEPRPPARVACPLGAAC